MALTWMGGAAVGILLFFGYKGYRRGFIKEILSFFFTFLALALAWTINPYVNEFIMERTPIYQTIQKNCESLVSSEENFNTESTEDSGEEQNLAIESLGLPQILRQSLEVNNTAEVYKNLAVDTFSEYVSSYLARSVTGGLSFLVSYILSSLLIRGATCILDIITGLPLIKGANRITGGLVGLMKGILIIWIILLAFTVFCSTEAGKTGLSLVEQDSFLKVLYKYDILVDFFMNIR